MLRADLAPISNPRTRPPGVMAKPAMPLPIGPSSFGIHEHAIVNVMPQNAARNGVYCNSSNVTIVKSGMNRCQELRSTKASDGISSGAMPASRRRLASRCTIQRIAR